MRPVLFLCAIVASIVCFTKYSLCFGDPFEELDNESELFDLEGAQNESASPDVRLLNNISSASNSSFQSVEYIGCSRCLTSERPCLNTVSGQCLAPYPINGSCPAHSALCIGLDTLFIKSCESCSGYFPSLKNGSIDNIFRPCLNTATGLCSRFLSDEGTCATDSAPCQFGTRFLRASSIVDCSKRCPMERPCFNSGTDLCFAALSIASDSAIALGAASTVCPIGSAMCVGVSSKAPMPALCNRCAPDSEGRHCINTEDTACFDTIALDTGEQMCPPGTTQCVNGQTLLSQLLIKRANEAAALSAAAVTTRTPTTITTSTTVSADTNDIADEDLASYKDLVELEPFCSACNQQLPCVTLQSSNNPNSGVCMPALNATDTTTDITKRSSPDLRFCAKASHCCNKFSDFCTYPQRTCVAANSSQSSDSSWCQNACNRRGKVSCPNFCTCTTSDPPNNGKPDNPGTNSDKPPGLSAGTKAVIIAASVLAGVGGLAILGYFGRKYYLNAAARRRDVLEYEDDRDEHYRAM